MLKIVMTYFETFPFICPICIGSKKFINIYKVIIKYYSMKI